MQQALVDHLAKLLRQGTLSLVPLLSPQIQALLAPYLGDVLGWAVPVATWLVAVGWGHLRAYWNKQELVQAAGAANLTVEEVKEMVASPTTHTPSVLTPDTQIPK